MSKKHQSKKQSSKQLKKQKQETRFKFHHKSNEETYIESYEMAPSSIAPSKKKWTQHDICSMRPATEKQSIAIEEYMRGQMLALLGSAGTGKTFLACYLASLSLVTPESKIGQIYVIRSAVQSRRQGFVPGDTDEKMDPYKKAYHRIFKEIFGSPNSFRDLVAAGKLEFDSTSFLRGTTIDNAVIIFDEAQNAVFSEIETVITRLGRNSRLIIIGDNLQNDLRHNNEVSGLPKFNAISSRMSDVSVITFTPDDVVRNDFIARWLKQREQYEVEQEELRIAKQNAAKSAVVPLGIAAA